VQACLLIPCLTGITAWLNAEAASVLPLHHHDPFDRMLIAQAQVESLVVVTVDKRFLDYDLELL